MKIMVVSVIYFYEVDKQMKFNSLKSVTEILPKFEGLSVSESRRGPDRETNEINLG